MSDPKAPPTIKTLVLNFRLMRYAWKPYLAHFILAILLFAETLVPGLIIKAVFDTIERQRRRLHRAVMGHRPAVVADRAVRAGGSRASVRGDRVRVFWHDLPPDQQLAAAVQPVCQHPAPAQRPAPAGFIGRGAQPLPESRRYGRGHRLPHLVPRPDRKMDRRRDRDRDHGQHSI